VGRDSLAITQHGERIARGSTGHKGALDYNARLVTAVRESYERRGRKTCWAAPA